MLDSTNKWQGQIIDHFGKGTGLLIKTAKVDENQETNETEASLAVLSGTSTKSPIAYLKNTNDNFKGEALFIEHSGTGKALNVNKTNKGYAGYFYKNHNDYSTDPAPVVHIENAASNSPALYAKVIDTAGYSESINNYGVVAKGDPAIQALGDIYLGFGVNRAVLNWYNFDDDSADAVFKSIDAAGIYSKDSTTYINGDVSISGDITIDDTQNKDIKIYGETELYGNLLISGDITKGGGSFKIDHPLDPYNKYLYHSFVESDERKNVYDGVVRLDRNGEAVIQLPDWFDALNRDFRYQLTCIGGWAQVYIAVKLKDDSFKISGGKPDMEVSWQITGVRKDPYAKINNFEVEVEKDNEEKGKLLYPETVSQYK